MNFDIAKLNRLELPLRYLLLPVLLSLFGVMILYSAAGGSWCCYASRNFSTMIVGIVMALSLMMIPQRYIYKSSYYVYAVFLFLLILNLLLGHTAMGAQRWLKLGPITVQPSEFAKIGLIMVLSRFYHDLHFFDTTKIRSIIIPLLLSCTMVALVLKQPNLGTAGIMIMIFVLISFCAGINIWLFIISSVLGMLSLPGLWFLLHDYQRNRVLTFLNPNSDPFGLGYNVIQSEVAIGSGGFWGQGFLQGSQGQLKFLPEKHTDFIMSIVAEELGWVSIVAIIALFLVFIISLFLKTLHMFNQFGRLIVVGMAGMIFFHMTINLLMISGFFPVVGIPFPFFSYGRSNLLANFIMLGLVLNSIRYSQITLSPRQDR